MNENFVFFLPEEDYYRIPYYELNELCNVEIVDALIDSKNKLLRMFYLFCFSTKINALITIPGKKFGLKLIIKIIIRLNQTILFFLMLNLGNVHVHIEII